MVLNEKQNKTNYVGRLKKKIENTFYNKIIHFYERKNNIQ